MRRSRWDQAPETEEPIASGSQWNGQCRPNAVNWNQTSRVQGGITSERDHVNTPHPLDYSSDSRQRSQNASNENASKEKADTHRKESAESSGNQTGLLPPPSTSWQYSMSNMHLYPGGNQNAQIAFPPLLPSSSWSQPHQGYYNGDYRENIFDLKWWDAQRQIIESHLRVNEGTSNAKEHHPSRSGLWSFGNRAFKHNDRNYDNGRKFNRYQSNVGYDRHKSFRDFRNFSHNSNFNSNSNNRYNKFENGSYKIDKRHMYSERDPQNNRNMWRYNNNNGSRDFSEHSKPQDYSRAYVSNVNNFNNGTFGKKTNFKTHKHSSSAQSKQGATVKKKKKEKKKDSAAEKERKKTLAAAASKLRLSFLAAKKNTTKKSVKKSKAVPKKSKNVSPNRSADNLSETNKIPDSSVPKSVPKEGTSLEHDIDIKFSASEWESVGRGEGGIHNVLEVPASGSKSSEVDLDDEHSDSDSVQTIDDIEYSKVSSNNESDNSELSSEEEEDQGMWNEEVMSVPGRRRHASETINVKFGSCNNNNNQPKRRRVRSYSTSQVEHGSPVNNSTNSTSFAKNLKNMLVKQLLSMDKKSLLELVDDPKSRKAQFMMNHFMSMHRNAVSQKLNQLRFRTSSTSADDEISELFRLSTPHLETLPSDILDQVKEILDFESKGKVEQMWEEVTLSISDIFSVISGGNKANKDILPENLQNSREVTNELNLRNVPDDFDCQIVTPPPKLPAATITIPDSDNEIHADICDINGSTICIISQDKESPTSVSPPNSPSPESEGGFLKPQDLTQSATSSSLHHPDRPPNPVPCSPPSLAHLLSPPHHSLKQSLHPANETPHSDRPPNPVPCSPPSLAHLLSPPHHSLKQSLHPANETPHSDRPPNPVPCSPPSLAHLLSPPHHSLKQSPHPTSETPHSDRPPNPVPCSPPPLAHLLSPPHHSLKQSPRPTSETTHSDRPPNPVPCSPPPLAHLLAPPHHSLKQSPHPTSETPHSLSVQHASPFIPPSPLVDTKRLKLSIKNKISEDNGITNTRAVCNINIQEPPPSIKVKQERPSPMMECGLCMHPPRSPHTQQCGFPFGISASPVAMMQGTPRPIGPVPPQRPVPHLASSSIPSIFKQENQRGTYLNLEHINRPSSEERPKNPAPPDNASSEPPSPLPIPPPQSTHHPPPPPPRPLIFSSEEQFSEPPRPPSPPPPQHSPRIKLERQTPQYICCCMRNECERSNSSRQSADFRRGSSTPQGQLCDSGTLSRATPHSVYKYEPPYLSSLRTRTPHNNGMVNMFSLLSPSARCIASSNNSLLQSIVPPHGLTASSSDAHHNSKVNVAVQTDKATRQYVPNVSFARSVTPLSAKTDQTTSTEDLVVSNEPVSPTGKCDNVEMSEEWKQRRAVGDASNCYVSTSSVQNDQVTLAINKFTEFKPTGTLFNQLIQLSNQENEILSCIDSVERKVRKYEEERKRLKEILQRINNCRLQKLHHYQLNASFCEVTDSEINTSKKEELSSVEELVVSNSINEQIEEQSQERVSDNCIENQYLVSSSQELPVEFKVSRSPSEFFNVDSHDSQSHSIHGERCTSTSLPKDILFPKESSEDSDDEDNSKASFCIKNKSHKYRLGKSCFRNRNRLNSGSTTDDYPDDKGKEIKDSSSHSNHNENMDDRCYGNENNNLANSSQIKLENEDGGDKEPDDLEFNNGDNTLMKVEDDNICSLSSNRKGSLSCSPQSPKMRNSSGSEHGYSLRSRGPPSDLFDFNSDSQLSKDTLISGQEEQLEIGDKQMVHDDEQADDEFEKEEDVELRNLPTTKLSSNESFRRRKRKRKTKYLNKCKKKKEGGDGLGSNQETSSSSSNINLESQKEIQSNNNEDQKLDLNFLPLEEKFELPPPHLDSVLDLKVVGNLIFSSSTDGTARLFDPSSGVVLSTYGNHTNSVTAIQVIGEPIFAMGSPGFFVVTGSEDGYIHVYDGKTGVMTQRKNCTEPVRCLNYRWGYLFIGTDGGSGIKWNLKDKKLGEKVQFCGKGIMRILTHIEGGRRVLVVGAKTTPIMIRDAMSGLFLRTLEYVQLTMYAGVFEGSLLYTGGTDKRIFVYDYCEGNVKDNFYAEASISGLILVDNFLVATCYDGYIRIFRLPKGDLLHSIEVESSHKMFICSALFKNKILLGNKNGEIVCCALPDLKN